MKRALLAALATAALVVLPASAAPVEMRLTLTGPASVAPDEQVLLSGSFTALEAGLPAQHIEILLDGEPTDGTVTAPDGTYQVVMSIPVGTHTLRATAYRGTPLAVYSEPLVIETSGDGLVTVRIDDVYAQRIPGYVHVYVDLSGTAVRVDGSTSPAVVTGEVTIVAPNPCWPDHSACVDVIDEKTLEFQTFSDEHGAYSVTVGPFDYYADGTGVVPSCARLWIHAVASALGHSAADTREQYEVCA